ncbi:hypothetical protein P3T21_004570 [Paraburkholderia sp. GAS334]
MAWYVNGSKLVKGDGNQPWWKDVYGPADEVVVSGIYCCSGCKREITSSKGDRWPPQNHHQHEPGQGPIRWTLSVRTNTQGVSLRTCLNR